MHVFMRRLNVLLAFHECKPFVVCCIYSPCLGTCTPAGIVVTSSVRPAHILTLADIIVYIIYDIMPRNRRCMVLRLGTFATISSYVCGGARPTVCACVHNVIYTTIYVKAYDRRARSRPSLLSSSSSEVTHPGPELIGIYTL